MDAVLLADLESVGSAPSNAAQVSALAMQAVRCCMSTRVGVALVHVEDREASAPAQNAGGLLIAGEVQRSVGGHDVNARVQQRDLLDIAPSLIAQAPSRNESNIYVAPTCRFRSTPVEEMAPTPAEHAAAGDRAARNQATTLLLMPHPAHIAPYPHIRRPPLPKELPANHHIPDLRRAIHTREVSSSSLDMETEALQIAGLSSFWGEVSGADLARRPVRGLMGRSDATGSRNRRRRARSSW